MPTKKKTDQHKKSMNNIAGRVIDSNTPNPETLNPISTCNELRWPVIDGFTIPSINSPEQTRISEIGNMESNTRSEVEGIETPLPWMAEMRKLREQLEYERERRNDAEERMKVERERLQRELEETEQIGRSFSTTRTSRETRRRI
jgi:hypothetical protein